MKYPAIQVLEGGGVFVVEVKEPRTKVVVDYADYAVLLEAAEVLDRMRETIADQLRDS
jgi:hypothetical protein